MSDALRYLLTNSQSSDIIRQSLPLAFEIVENELKGNPAVGLLREHVLIGMFTVLLDGHKVERTKSGVHPDIDCYIDSTPLSIKTISYKGSIRLKWTSNAVKAEEFIGSYKPTSDLLVVRIVWGKEGEMRLIPLSLQQQVLQKFGKEQYLSYKGSTNTRGVNLAQNSELALNSSKESISLPIHWKLSGNVPDPIDRWIEYWTEAKNYV